MNNNDGHLGAPITMAFNEFIFECKADVATHIAYPDSLLQLLFVPLEKRIAKTGIDFFIPKKKQYYFSVKNMLRNILGRRVENKYYYLKNIEIISPINKDNVVRSIVSSGTKGPYNKAALITIDDNQEIRFITKIASSTAAKDLLNNEKKWLGLLNNYVPMKKHIPKVVNEVGVENMFTITTTVNKGSRLSQNITREHLLFIEKLHSAQPSSIYYESNMYSFMMKTWSETNKVMSGEWRYRIEKALNIINNEFLVKSPKMVVAHRDFTPWNIYLSNGDVYVYDWEYADSGYIPLYDAFHLIFLPKVLKDNLSYRDLTKTFRKLKNLVDKNYINNNYLNFKMDVQCLAYLVDICLFYLKSNNGEHRGDKVVILYGDLIDQYEYWRSK